MQVHVVHAHPSEHSFTAQVRDELLRGLADGGHTATVSDLYRMGFATDMTEAEYLRDAHYDATPPLAPDVVAEQRRINAADALVLVYPVFWTEAPAKLVGWFDRARSKDLVLLGGTSRDDPERREANRPIHLRRVYELAVGLGR